MIIRAGPGVTGAPGKLNFGEYKMTVVEISLSLSCLLWRPLAHDALGDCPSCRYLKLTLMVIFAYEMTATTCVCVCVCKCVCEYGSVCRSFQMAEFELRRPSCS